jgi:hypothetical protein
LGRFVWTLQPDGSKSGGARQASFEGEIVMEVVPYGGHNKVTASNPVALAVARSLND